MFLANTSIQYKRYPHKVRITAPLVKELYIFFYLQLTNYARNENIGNHIATRLIIVNLRIVPLNIAAHRIQMFTFMSVLFLSFIGAFM